MLAQGASEGTPSSDPLTHLPAQVGGVGVERRWHFPWGPLQGAGGRGYLWK